MTHIVIDITTPETTAILQVTDLERSLLWTKLYEAEGRKIIAPELGNKAMSKLDTLPLQYLYWNFFQVQPPLEFPALSKPIFDHIKTLEMDKTAMAELQWRVELLATNYNEKISDADLNVEGTATGRIPANQEAQSNTPKTEEVTKVKAVKAPNRPREGTTTAHVWDIADGMHASDPGLGIDSKEFRTCVIDQCVEAGINKSTAATQYGKWKASKLAE